MVNGITGPAAGDGAWAAEEEGRLAALDRYGLRAGPRLPALRPIVELAAYLCGVPTAVVNIIGEDRQFQVAAVGLEPADCAREDSMCALAIVEPRAVVVPDARCDPRYRANPFVTGEIAHVRFYASSQLRAPEGDVLGTLCVFDDTVRTLDAAQVRGLDMLAGLVVDTLELHRRDRLLRATLDQLEGTRAELARSNGELHHFAAQISHDLKAPLSAALGFAEALQTCERVHEDPTAVRYTERIIAATDRMGELIDDVLSYASAGGALRLAAVPLDEVAREVVEELARPIAEAGVDVVIEPLPLVRADRTQVRVLLQNLIANAVKYRRPGRRPRILLRAEQDGPRCTIRVIDNGQGIPAERREEAMQMFGRLGHEGAGFGVGLATCRRVVDAHGGLLRIEETPGGGTTVVFDLAAAGAQLPAQARSG